MVYKKLALKLSFVLTGMILRDQVWQHHCQPSVAPPSPFLHLAITPHIRLRHKILPLGGGGGASGVDEVDGHLLSGSNEYHPALSHL